MSITLGPITFDETNTSARERHDEVGGRDARTITIEGLVSGSTVAEIEANLDAILDAASAEDYTAALSLRDDRRIWVRRNKYTREIDRESLAGAFTLELEARDPFEESVDETTINWNVTASGQTQPITPGGNVFAKPRIALVASGDVINPTFSDGTRTIAYMGTVADGETLVFDAVKGTVTREGADVAPYTTGLFPNLEPEGTAITYTDDVASSHTATVTIAYRDRWW